MKKLLLLTLLASCTSKPTYTPLQEAVRKYAQHIEPDSARYTPLRFSKPQPFTRTDSLQPVIDQYSEMTDSEASLMMASAKLVDLGKMGTMPAAQLRKASREHDSIVAQFNMLSKSRLKLLHLASDKVVGQEVHHSWRVGERVDSARFVVFNNGEVKKLK